MLRLLTVFLCFICVLSKGQSTKEFKTNFNDTFYNVIVPDPYRSLEDTGNLKVKAWMKQESDYAKSTFTSMPGYKKLYDKYKFAVENSKFEDVRYISRINNQWYAIKGYPYQNNPMLYKYNKIGKETLIMDPEKEYSQLGSKNISLQYFVGSPHGIFSAYSVVIGGNETQPVHGIDNLRTGKKNIDTIFRSGKRYFSCFNNINDSVFYYLFAPHKNEGDPIHWFDSTLTYKHKVGESTNNDELIIDGLSDKIPKKLDDIAEIDLPLNSYWAVAKIQNQVSKELRIYVTPINTLSKFSNWKKVSDYTDEITDYVVRGNDIFMLTYKNAPLFKVIVADLTKPQIIFNTILPEQSFALNEMKSTKEFILLTGLSDNGGKLIAIPFKSLRYREIKLPLSGEASINYAAPDSKDFIFTMNSWTRSSETFEYNGAAQIIKTSSIRKYPSVGNKDLVVKEVKVKSHDGVLIPMTLVFKKGMENKSKYAQLTAYGAYGIQDHPASNPLDIIRYNMGYLKAVAHVRGGGIYGDKWHKAGMMGTKSNTWKDVIACSEYLIQNKYATKDNLFLWGGSAGGITVGRSITERPDLFKGAIISVGSLDMVGAERSPNGFGNIAEFGSVKTKEGFVNLYGMSTYHHIKDRVKYPATIFFHGVNDNRVPVYNSLKTYAKMKEVNTSGTPLLLDLNYDSGHGQETNTSLVSRITDQQSFIFWILGIPEFQPIKN